MIFWLFTFATLVQIVYTIWFAIAQTQGSQTRSTSPAPGLSRVFADGERAGERSPVSVIICAKNEAANLRKNLPVVLGQQYGAGYEVVVVNDASTDDTAAVLAELCGQHRHLRVVTVEADEQRTLKGKKHALSKGVAAASHEWLLLTDADCVPAGDEWLARMVAPLRERRAGSGERWDKEIVLGYGGYTERAGLLNAFIRWETMHTWLQYSSYARAGVPYMAVGRNMACTKAVLLQAQAHERWNVLPSGDDDMLVQLMGTKHNVAVAGDAQAFTHSEPKASWGSWVRQKQRHLSVGKYYKGGTRLLLSTYAITHGQVWGAGTLMCMAQWGWLPAGLGDIAAGYWPWVLPLLAVRSVVAWGVWSVAARRLRQKSLLLWMPLMDIGWLCYNFGFLPWITWKNKRQWT